MAWRYCECGRGLDHPTDREALTDDYNCHICGASIEVWEDERHTALLNILFRLDELESTVENTND